MNITCPSCTQSAEPREGACPVCGTEYPWVASEKRLLDEIKSRETNRIRAIVTLIEDGRRWAQGSSPFPAAAIKGAVAALLLPRLFLIAGSILGVIALLAQTWIVFRQTEIMSEQNSLIRSQSISQAFEIATKLRGFLAESVKDRTKPAECSDTEEKWGKPVAVPSVALASQISLLYSSTNVPLEPILLNLMQDRDVNISSAVLSQLARHYATKRRQTKTNMMLGLGPNAYLRHATFPVADFERVSFDRAQAEAVSFYAANLKSTSWFGSRLEDAHFAAADLSDASMKAAHLVCADMSKVNLHNADLTDADLRYANLQEARNWKELHAISGAKIHGVRNAPDGFREWAILKGAIDEPSPYDLHCATRMQCKAGQDTVRILQSVN